VTITGCLVTDGASTFSGVQDAVNAATAGDTVDVEGSRTGPVEIGKSLFLGTPLQYSPPRSPGLAQAPQAPRAC
jgi:hypothetical protein